MARFMLIFALPFGIPFINVPIIIFMYWGLAKINLPIDNSWPDLFGDKSHSAFDVWSIQHFLCGILIGASLTGPLKNRWDQKNILRATIFIVCFWELQEFSGELGMGMFDLPPVLGAEWFGGVEHWSNRLIADPCLVITGSFIGHNLMMRARKYQILGLQLITAVFFFAHVLSPDVMYFQELLFG